MTFANRHDSMRLRRPSALVRHKTRDRIFNTINFNTNLKKIHGGLNRVVTPYSEDYIFFFIYLL